MKRVELIRTIEGFGCVLARHGEKHDWYRNPATNISQPVPRHLEIKEHLARHIRQDIKQPLIASETARFALPGNSFRI